MKNPSLSLIALQFIINSPPWVQRCSPSKTAQSHYLTIMGSTTQPMVPRSAPRSFWLQAMTQVTLTLYNRPSGSGYGSIIWHQSKSILWAHMQSDLIHRPAHSDLAHPQTNPAPQAGQIDRVRSHHDLDQFKGWVQPINPVTGLVNGCNPQG